MAAFGERGTKSFWTAPRLAPLFPSRGQSRLPVRTHKLLIGALRWVSDRAPFAVWRSFAPRASHIKITILPPIYEPVDCVLFFNISPGSTLSGDVARGGEHARPTRRRVSAPK